jgi:hypothetical protein
LDALEQPVMARSVRRRCVCARGCGVFGMAFMPPIGRRAGQLLTELRGSARPA